MSTVRTRPAAPGSAAGRPLCGRWRSIAYGLLARAVAAVGVKVTRIGAGNLGAPPP